MVNQNILMIGGAGYIGSVVARTLTDLDHHIIICDDLSTGYKDNIIPDVKFYQIDMCDRHAMEKVFLENKIDLVIHFAAKIIVPESVKMPNQYYETNINGLCICLDLMHKYHVKKIIFASSAAVYGDYQGDELITEQTPKKPINPYGQTKLINEWSLINCKKVFDINYVALRFFNVAGATSDAKYGNRKPKPSALIPAINDCLLHHKEIKIYGNDFSTPDGTCLRDYVHVQDLAQACFLAIDFLNKEQCGIFNLGSGRGHSVKEVVDLALKKYDPDHKVVIFPRREGDPAKLITDNHLAALNLKWRPKYSLLEMIVSDYEFRKNNRL